MQLHLGLVLLGFASFLFGTPVFAETSDEKPLNTTSSPDATDAARLRFGIAAGVTGGFAEHRGEDESVSARALAPAATLDLGIQLSRYWGVYARGTIGSVAVSNVFSSYGIVEYTPNARFSFGSGFGYDVFGGSAWSVQMMGGSSPLNFWHGLSVPVVAAFHLNDADGWAHGQRHEPFRIQLEMALGLQFGTAFPGSHATLSFGKAWM